MQSYGYYACFKRFFEVQKLSIQKFGVKGKFLLKIFSRNFSKKNKSLKVISKKYFKIKFNHTNHFHVKTFTKSKKFNFSKILSDVSQ
jgi:hypothetical protein